MTEKDTGQNRQKFWKDMTNITQMPSVDMTKKITHNPT
jgi:hypothetical protein